VPTSPAGRGYALEAAPWSNRSVTTPVDDEGVDAPLRLQPVVARPQGWRGRSGGLVGVGLVVFLVVAVALGTALDDRGPSGSAPIAVASLASSSPTTRPSARPTITREPLATPLPTLEVVGGQVPGEVRPVFANGVELLDLATGVLTPFAPPIDYPSLAAPLPNGEIACACVVRQVTAATTGSTSLPSLRFRRFDRAGTPIIERDIVSLEGAVEVPNMTEGFNVAIALDPDGRSMYVLFTERRPPVWTVVLYVVHVETGEVLAIVDIDQVSVDLEEPGISASPRPGGGPRDGVYVWSTSVAVAPGGRSVLVSVDRAEVRSDNWTNQMLEWMVEVAPGTLATSTPLSRAAALEPGAWCMSQPTYVDASLLVQVCGGLAEGSVGGLYVRRIGPDGESLGQVPITSPPFDGGYPVSVVVDRPRRALFAWHLQDHALVRVDLDDGRVTKAAVSRSMLPDVGRPTGGRGYVGGDPGLVRSPDGRLLFAIGVTGTLDGGLGVPSGIWVFDADSLQLVDHWAPRAFLSSLAVSRDGRFVYAAGAAGFDVDGRENAWPASVTVYDAATGEIQLVYGAVTRGSWLGFVTLP